MADAVTADLFAGIGPEAQFRQGLREGRIRLQHCEDCLRTVFYPRVLCPHCGGVNLSWRESRGQGHLYSFTWVEGEKQQPYNICLVELTEGVRVLSRVDDVEPGQLHIGMPLTADIALENDQPFIVFRVTDTV